jgi:hypothetical protein
MRRSLLTAAAFVVVCSGCYTYQIADPATVQAGRDVRVRLSLEAADRLQEVRMTDDRLLEGKLLERRGDQLVVETAVNRLDPMTGGRLLNQRLNLPYSDLQEVETKALDRTRTAGVVALAGAVVGYIVVSQFQDGGGSDTGPPSGPPESRVIRIPLLGVPISF